MHQSEPAKWAGAGSNLDPLASKPVSFHAAKRPAGDMVPPAPWEFNTALLNAGAEQSLPPKSNLWSSLEKAEMPTCPGGKTLREHVKS